MIYYCYKAGICIIGIQIFDIYLKEKKVNIKLYFDRIYTINGQKMKVINVSASK
jgi:hypothetical protein